MTELPDDPEGVGSQLLANALLRIEIVERERDDARAYGGEARSRENAERRKFEAARGRAESAEALAATLRIKLKIAEEALRFYAYPPKDADVPDFYDELGFGDRALYALEKLGDAVTKPTGRSE